MDTTNLDIKGRTFLITGGTSGVGKAVATGLAKLGAKIVIVSRSSESGQAALNAIAQASGNDKGEFLVADLSLQSSVRQASEEFKRKYDNLHVLANLAGAAYFEKQLTPEGIERTFAVNYLGHFLLTHQLLDMLKESGPSRVITVTGAPLFVKNPKINFDDLQVVKNFSSLRASGQSLHARTIFSFELAKRLKGTDVTSVVFYCGPVTSNLLNRPDQRVPWVLKLVDKYFASHSKDDCEIGVYLAASKEVEKVSGVFFNNKKQITPCNYDEAVGQKLWEASEELIGSTALAI